MAKADSLYVLFGLRALVRLEVGLRFVILGTDAKVKAPVQAVVYAAAGAGAEI